jgi:hypothetical protein
MLRVPSVLRYPGCPVYPVSLLAGPICIPADLVYISHVQAKVFDMERDELIRRLKILIIAVAMYVAMC